MSTPSQRDRHGQEGDSHDQGPVPALMGSANVQDEIARQTRILKKANNGFVALDLDGVVVRYLGGGVTLWGKPPEEVIGQNYRTVPSNPEEAERRMRMVGRVLQGEIVDQHSDYDSSRRGRVVQDITGTPIYADDEKTVIGALLEIDDKTREAILDELDRDILKLGEQTTLDGVLHKIGDYASTLAGVWMMRDPDAPKSSLRTVRKIDAATASDDADAHPSYEVTKLILSGADESEGGWTRAQTEGMADVEGMAASPVWHWLMHNDRPLIMGREEFQSCVYDEAHPANIYDPVTNPGGNLISRHVAEQRGIFSMGAFLLRDEEGEPIGDLRVYNKESWSDDDVRFLGRLCAKASVAISNATMYQNVVAQRHAIGEFLRFALHDVKNPASSVAGFAKALIRPLREMETMAAGEDGQVKSLIRMAGEFGARLDEGVSISDEELRGFVEGIRANAERVGEIVGKYLERAGRNLNIILEEGERIGDEAVRYSSAVQSGKFSGDLEAVVVGGLLSEVGRTYVQEIEDRGQSYTVQEGEGLPDAFTVRADLRRVMDNLFINAVHNTPREGEIFVRAHERGEGPDVNLIELIFSNTTLDKPSTELSPDERASLQGVAESIEAKLTGKDTDTGGESSTDGWGIGLINAGQMLKNMNARKIAVQVGKDTKGRPTIDVIFSMQEYRPE